MDSLDHPHPGVYDSAGSATDQADVQGEEWYFTDSDDSDPHRFINFGLLSHLAVQLHDNVPEEHMLRAAYRILVHLLRRT